MNKNYRRLIRNRDYGLTNIKSSYDDIEIVYGDASKYEVITGENGLTQVYVYNFYLELKNKITNEVHAYNDKLYIPVHLNMKDKYKYMYEEIHKHFNEILVKYNNQVVLKTTNIVEEGA